MSKWTEEPLRLTKSRYSSGYRILDCHGREVAVVSSNAIRGVEKEYATRIVSCVNALAGLDPEAVGELVEAARAALKHADDAWWSECGPSSSSYPMAYEDLESVLSKLETPRE